MMTAKNGAFFCPLKHDVRLATSQRSQNVFEIAFDFLHSYQAAVLANTLAGKAAIAPLVSRALK